MDHDMYGWYVSIGRVLLNEVRNMRGRSVWFAVVSGGLMLAVATPLRGQTAPTQSADNEHARRSVAINTLRAITTAEYAFNSKHCTFASWDVLIASEEFTGRGMHFAVHNEPQLANLH